MYYCSDCEEYFTDDEFVNEDFPYCVYCGEDLELLKTTEQQKELVNNLSSAYKESVNVYIHIPKLKNLYF